MFRCQFLFLSKNVCERKNKSIWEKLTWKCTFNLLPSTFTSPETPFWYIPSPWDQSAMQCKEEKDLLHKVTRASLQNYQSGDSRSVLFKIERTKQMVCILTHKQFSWQWILFQLILATIFAANASLVMSGYIVLFVYMAHCFEERESKVQVLQFHFPPK